MRFSGDRPGLTLVGVEDAALPVTVVATDVVAQERKPLALLDEFVLRFADAGLSTVDEIAQVLGLESRLVESTIADQAIAENISIGASTQVLALTRRGKQVVQDHEAIQPVQKQIFVTF